MTAEFELIESFPFTKQDGAELRLTVHLSPFSLLAGVTYAGFPHGWQFTLCLPFATFGLNYTDAELMEKVRQASHDNQ